MSLLGELKRRNVFRVAIAYLFSAWLLIQLADILIPMLTLPEWVDRLIFLLLFILFIPTLIAAWALELTPDGLKLEKNVDRSESITPHTGKKLNSITIGVLALAVVVLLIDKMFLNADSSADATVDKSIAVLPFADLSEGQDQEWFADGLAEEILNALSRTPDLMVASRTSAFAYKDSVKDLRVIADELDVAHILEGSVRRAGERLRVTAQLIRASDGFHVWSENYDRNAADVIEVQEDLAVKIASAMKTTMDPDALADMLRVGTRSVDAYQAYLRGMTLFAQGLASADYDAMLASYEMYEQARSIDPNFATAHRKAAYFWLLQGSPTMQYSDLIDATAAEISSNYLERIDQAIDAAANAIDRQGLEAEKALYELRLRRALTLYQSYLEARPRDLDAWVIYSDVAAYLSDKESRVAALEHLKLESESRSLAALGYLGAAYRIVDASDAADFGLELLQRWPDSADLMYQVHRTLMWAKRADEAAVLARRYEEIHGFERMMQARQACMEGRVQDVLDILATERAENGDHGNVEWLMLLLLDDKESAEALLRHYESDEAPQVLVKWLIYHKFDPRPFPGLMALLERENVDRPPPVEMPYTCPPTDDK